MDALEKQATEQGYHLIAGADEAGRGPLAGPVVGACVIWSSALYGLGVADSKSLSPAKRELIVEALRKRGVAYGVGLVEAEEIDATDILKASLKAMAAAVNSLPCYPHFLLVDGSYELKVPIPQRAVVKGDQLSISVAAASILAKVMRDRLMETYHGLFPQYSFNKNKGYPTREHCRALEKLGPSPLHRQSFARVKGRPARGR